MWNSETSNSPYRFFKYCRKFFVVVYYPFLTMVAKKMLRIQLDVWFVDVPTKNKLNKDVIYESYFSYEYFEVEYF